MLTEGQILEGKYRIDRLLSRGGMGAVFVGQHTRIKRKVAIKVLLEGMAGSAEAMQRFEKEAQAAGQIGSDHIVEVLDLGTTPEGDRFMVMEFLDGETLKERIAQRGRLTPFEAVPLVTQLLKGLAAAHAAGIIHRDLKPDNVFLLKEKAGHNDFVKIVDFGISKFNSLIGEEGQMTKTGTVMGTPFYMSPEQARAANEVDARSDLYSVGVLLYESVTGLVPFKATTFAELVFKIVFEEPPHPNSVVPSLDGEFATIIMKAMARNAPARYQTAGDLQAALERWLAERGGAGQGVAHGGGHAYPRPLESFNPPPAAPGGAAAGRPASEPAAFGAGTAILADSLTSPPLHADGGPPPGRDPNRPHAPPTQAMVGGHPALHPAPLAHGETASAGEPLRHTHGQGNAASAPPKRRTGLIAAVAVASLALGGVAAVWVSGGGAAPEPAPTATPSSDATAPEPSPPVEPTATAPPSAHSAEPPELPSATPSADPVATASPAPGLPPTRPPPRPTGTPPAGPVKTPKPSLTVDDLGY